jgi:hypothetical protein
MRVQASLRLPMTRQGAFKRALQGNGKNNETRACEEEISQSGPTL